MTKKRYLSLWFPEWPLTRLRRKRLKALAGARRTGCEKPAEKKIAFALLETTAKGLQIAAVNNEARRLGVVEGLKFTDAKARAPQLVSEEINREEDLKALDALARWMVRYTPYFALDGDDGLLLETTGCDHLFGGEAALCRHIGAKLNKENVPHRIGLAGTPGAAHALARAGATDTPAILASGDEAKGLAALSVATLRLSQNAHVLLRRFGLLTIGQLYDIDRKSLARRFHSREAADAVCLRLDQALGRRAEPVSPIVEPPDYAARLPCPEPLLSLEGAQEGLSRLAVELCRRLDADGRGAREMTLTAHHTDETRSSFVIRAARPIRNPAHVTRLFNEKIQSLDPGFGIDLLLLAADRVERSARTNHALSGDLAPMDVDPEALAALADRINARFGDGAVTISLPAESYIPERSAMQAAYHGEALAEPRPVAQQGPAPLRIFETPEPVEVLAEVPDGPPRKFIWRRVPRLVLKADGPRRIAPEWWRLDEPRARARDYYRVEDERGQRYWIFRDGLYGDDRGDTPAWYVHGLFP